MKNNSCDYCGYEEEAIPNLTTASSYAERQLIQPQVIINNQIVSSPEAAPEISRKNKMVALLLCIFLGLFGVHRYYVGKVGTGTLYLLTGGLFGIGWVVDIVLIVAGSFKDRSDLPLRQ